MYFTKISLIGRNTVVLPLSPVSGLAPTTPYILKSVDGLGPPDIALGMGQSMNGGGYYQGSLPQSREIVPTIELNPSYSNAQTVSDLRAALYTLITPNSSKPIEVRFTNITTDVVYTFGYIKSMEAAIFSKDPAVQLTIECPSPYLTASTNVSAVPASLSKTAPSLTLPAGTAPSGLLTTLTFTAAVSSFMLTSQDNTQKFLVTYPFAIGDQLTIDTRPGSKNVSIVRSSIVIPLLGNLSADSNWLALYSGANVFNTNTQSFTWSSFLTTPLYWGI
jgi:hypothetical protein